MIVDNTDLWHTTHAEDFTSIFISGKEHTSHVRSLSLELLHCSIQCLQHTAYFKVTQEMTTITKTVCSSLAHD